MSILYPDLSTEPPPECRHCNGPCTCEEDKFYAEADEWRDNYNCKEDDCNG